MRSNRITGTNHQDGLTENLSSSVEARNAVRVGKLETLLGDEKEITLHGIGRLGELYLRRDSTGFFVRLSRAATRKERSALTPRFEAPIFIIDIELSPDGSTGRMTGTLKDERPKGIAYTRYEYPLSLMSSAARNGKGIAHESDLDEVFETIAKFTQIPHALRRDTIRRTMEGIGQIPKTLGKLLHVKEVRER